MRTENRTCRGIRRSVLIFLIRGNTLPALLLPFRSAWICSSTAALPGSAWQNGIFPPKTRNALLQRRMLKRCFSGSGPKRRATASGGEPVFRVLLERKRKRHDHFSSSPQRCTLSSEYRHHRR